MPKTIHPNAGRIESYLWEISPRSQAQGGTMEALRLAAERIGVSLTTVHRWRARGEIAGSEHVVAVLTAVQVARWNAGADTPITLEDVKALAGL